MEWISVTNKLPQDEERVLLLFELKNDYFKEFIYNIATYSENLKRVDEYDFEKEKCGFYKWSESEDRYVEIEDVLYWMPLPKPPKGK